jgi:hypothetical protein
LSGIANATQNVIDSHSDWAANSFGEFSNATSDGVAISFRETANATQNAINVHSDLRANSFDWTVNTTRMQLMIVLIYKQIHLVELLMQFRLQLMQFLI